MRKALLASVLLGAAAGLNPAPIRVTDSRPGSPGAKNRRKARKVQRKARRINRK